MCAWRTDREIGVEQRESQAAMSMADTASIRSCDSSADHLRLPPNAVAKNVRATSVRPVRPVHPYLQAVLQGAARARLSGAASAGAGQAAKDIQGDRTCADVSRGGDRGFLPSVVVEHPVQSSAGVDRTGLLYTDAAHLVFDKGRGRE